MKKIVLLAFVSVLLSTTIVWGFVRPTVAHTNESNSSHSEGTFVFTSSKTIWVPDNFTSIQEAIDNASDGDTIFVRAGIYYENVIVNKRVSLIGESKSNTIVDGDRKGTVIRLDCDNITISGFTIQKSAYWALEAGISVSSGNNISHNILRDNSEGILLYYYSSNNLILDNTASNNGHGIYIFHHSNNNTVSGNNVSNNHYGITVYDQSSNNTITSNTVSSNEYGIELIGGFLINNAIYQNNFINNTQQVYIDTFNSYNNVWDADYPSGGNYWSNYTGVDLYSGQYQNEVGSDGIGDTSHDVDVDNQDGFPLMGPFSFFNAGTWDEITYYVDTVSNSTVSNFYFGKDDKLVSFNVTGPDDTVGFCRVAIPKELLWCDNPEQWEVWVNNTLIEDGKIMEDTSYTYIYFTYNHTTRAVTIVGTAVIPIPPNADAGPDQSVFKGMTVTFDGSNSTDNVGIASYTWSFVDVTPKTLTGMQPNYTFSNVGDFEVTLNVSDHAGYWDTDMMWVHVLLDTTKPSIGDVSQVPTIPDDGEEVTITVDVTDEESGVHNVTISYRTNSGPWTNVSMSKLTGDTWEGEIPGQSAGTNVTYKIIAYDKAGNSEIDDQLGQYYVYTVIPEFPTWTSMLLILIVLTVAIAIYKRRLLETPIH